jgi:hypothetical protein
VTGSRVPLRTRTVLVIAGCFAWALLHKEHGIVLPALLLMTELVLRADAGFAEPADGAAPRWMLARTLTLHRPSRTSSCGSPSSAASPATRRIRRSKACRWAGACWVMLGLVPEFVRLFLWPASAASGLLAAGGAVPRCAGDRDTCPGRW